MYVNIYTYLYISEHTYIIMYINILEDKYIFDKWKNPVKLKSPIRIKVTKMR